VNDEKRSQGNVDGGISGTFYKSLKQDEMARFVLIFFTFLNTIYLQSSQQIC
jgi:hypothetical protein